MLIRLFEIFTIVVFGLFLLTQMIIPLWQGRLMFPWFRKSSKLEHKLAEVKEHKVESRLEQMIEEEELNIKTPKK